MTKSVRCTMLAVVLAGAASAAQADTIAHWRFEGGSFLADSSGNGHTLTAVGSPTQVASFNGPIGGSNAASLSNSTTGAGSTNYFTAADSPDFEGTNGLQLSVEALITPGTANPNVSQVIVGHFGAAPGRSWFLSVTNGALRFFTDVNGSNGAGTRQWNATTLPLTAGTNYYVAATLDLTEGTESARPITFYVQDLDNPLAILQSATITQGAGVFSTLIDSNSPLTIGSTGTSTSGFNGQLDEVRLSDAKLDTSELLIPEPASVGLLVLGGLAIVGRRR